MKFGIIGLGKMGAAIAWRAMQGGHEVVGFDLNQDTLKAAGQMGVEIADSIEDVAKRARIVWLMVPVGKPVDIVLEKLIPHLQKGDIIIDGGNSYFKDSEKRAELLKPYGIFFLDCGTSGGLHGKQFGFSLMVGGEKEAYDKIYSILESIAAPDGFGYMGLSGAGHYVKMVHNAIEYGLLQAYAEGFHLLKEGQYKDLDLQEIANIWINGSIIRSWILELASEIYAEDVDMEKVVGEIAEGGTGKWGVDEAKEQKVPMNVIQESLDIRRRSRETGGNYATKLVALLRNKFGGHEVKKK